MNPGLPKEGFRAPELRFVCRGNGLRREYWLTAAHYYPLPVVYAGPVELYRDAHSFLEGETLAFTPSILRKTPKSVSPTAWS